ncbi:MAG: TetR/AcrR family transcriptional regulator [Treponema sp.]|nr:TetR/AcrR family transcriptional regulator [Treponema sp.]
MSDKYHHGDLRNALIEEGIKMINTGGEESLSMRKLAEKCGVTMAAPYAHFKNKEDMINAIKNYVTDSFSVYLENAVDKVSDKDIEQKIIALGNAYVTFFINNPEYFTFLFSRGYIHANLDFAHSDENDFKPFVILKNLCTQYFDEKKAGLSDYQKELEVIRIWASVQGLTSIIFMKNVKWSRDWKKEVSNLLI